MNRYHFDLEKTLSAWRRSMESNRIFSGDDLDELESHLRDHVAALVREGRTEAQAFERAMQEMGDYGTAEREYRKVYWGKLHRQHRLAGELVARIAMLRNYFKIAVRSLLRQKGYSSINIGGLTLGLVCCLLIFQYVIFAYSFDRFNENAPALYRVATTMVQNEGESNTWARSQQALGPALAEASEVVRTARLHPDYSAIVSIAGRPDIVFEEDQVYYADPSFLQMFSYPLVSGDPARALAEPGTMLLSETAARKYFGQANPVGQVMAVTGSEMDGAFRVAGVFQDVPANSHLQFDLLLPMDDLIRRNYSDPADAWGWWNFVTYVQLRADANLSAVERKATDVLVRHQEEFLRQRHMTAQVGLQPLAEIHLNEGIAAPKAVMGSYRTVYFFTVIGLITLLIAIVNYVNIATARALSRAGEIGVRKVVGAQRRQLMAQFLLESALTAFMAVVLAVALAEALRPAVNALAGTTLPDALWLSPGFWTVFVVVFGFATILAGLYPAFVLSSFKPATALTGKIRGAAAGARLRRGLVVFQFAASVVLLIGTAVVYTQLTFMREMDLGINLEQVLIVPAPRVLPEGIARAEAIETFTQELSRFPAIRQAAASSNVPGRGVAFATSLRKAAADPSTEEAGVGIYIDTSFVSLYDLELMAGTGFSNISLSVPAGEPVPILANESAIQAAGFQRLEEALGEELQVGPYAGRLTGIVKDFNWSSGHRARENMVFVLAHDHNQIWQVSLKVSTENLPRTIAAVEEAYKLHYPGNPFSYTFADEEFDRQYLSDRRFAALFAVFATLAVLIACLGLFGLAAYTAEQRTKEIGIRKALGATVPAIVALLSADFLKLVLIAFAIAAPVSYFLMQRWLEDFAYRIEIGPAVYLLIGGLVLLIAFTTVGYQSIRAALADPVKSLRYE